MFRLTAGDKYYQQHENTKYYVGGFKIYSHILVLSSSKSTIALYQLSAKQNTLKINVSKSSTPMTAWFTTKLPIIIFPKLKIALLNSLRWVEFNLKVLLDSMAGSRRHNGGS